METDIDLLITILKRIDADKTIHVEYSKDFGDHPLISAAKYLADKSIIDENGRLLVDNIDKLKAEGYNVFPGEKDRSGWLVGCIQLQNGVLRFG